MTDPHAATDGLAALAADVALHAHVPYSGWPVGAALRLADGRTVAAARLENAAFPLTIPALVGAWALAGVAGAPPVAVALSRALTPGERAFIAEWGDAGGDGWTFPADDRAVRFGTKPSDEAAVSFAIESPLSPADGTAEALAAAAHAVVPASGFRVGAVVKDADGRAVWGANVEHPLDWTRGLCAERIALVAARATGLGPVRRVAIACPSAPGGTPCGACRQVLAELAPDAEIVLWTGSDAPLVTTVEALLPGAFRGESLGR